MISAVTFSGNLIGDFRFSMRLDTSMTKFQFLFASFTSSCHTPITFCKLPFLPKTNMKHEDSAAVTQTNPMSSWYITPNLPSLHEHVKVPNITC